MFDPRLHETTIHSTGERERPFACPECPGRSFARPDQLRAHSAVHSGERRHLCAECGTAFIHQSNLVRSFTSIIMNCVMDL